MEDRKIRKRAGVEMEGGGSSWWYVCEECHGAVNYLADICPHCDSVLSWEGFGLPRQPQRRSGEHTEPAE